MAGTKVLAQDVGAGVGEIARKDVHIGERNGNWLLAF